MLGSLLLFTCTILLAALHQYRYWTKQGRKREAQVFLLWMGVAWGCGMLFLAGITLPSPTRPPFGSQ
ncbi:hypothetical protein LOK74_13780 [Brevibacillus humidisoli]|uniref:hypothetical protein n=1 Tax=Brevibacillus humidisoli TaxID=2895522 RepID=UPI001E36D41A|nr:hypothetical protein [Brevibacillus humidisoli]UFJ39139.1 hypothetical protein LOK74_13780 [Brevibacillus humidisoli]